MQKQCFVPSIRRIHHFRQIRWWVI